MNATERGLVIKHSGLTSNTTSLVQDGNNSRGELNTKNRSLFIQAGTDGFGSGERFRILVNQIASQDILNDGTVLFPVANQKISGSATSTGSFAKLILAENLHISDGKSVNVGNDNDFTIHHSSNSYLTNNTGNLYFRQKASGASHIFQQTSGNTTVVEISDGGSLVVEGGSSPLIRTTGNIVSTGANKVISGSSTSTGSFGALYLGPQTSFPDRVDLFVKNATGAKAIFVGDGAGDTTILKLGTSHGRHWSFIASPYDTYAPGNAYDLEIGYTLDNVGDHNELSGSIVFNNYKNVAFIGSGSVGIGTREPARELHVSTTAHTYLRTTSGGTNKNSAIEFTDGTNFFYSGLMANESGVSAGEFTIYTGGSHPAIVVEQGGDVKFGVANQKISGSASSTGSFGNLMLGDVGGAQAKGRVFYEEGEYNPTIVTDSSGTITLNSSYDTLRYTRTGRLVHISGTIIVGSVSSPVGTHVRIGLPSHLTSANDGTDVSDRAGGTYVYYDNSEGKHTMYPCFIDENDSYIVVHFNGVYQPADTQIPNVNTIAASDQFRISITYTI